MMTPKEITQEVERRFEAEQRLPYGQLGSPRKAKRRIRSQIERQAKQEEAKGNIVFRDASGKPTVVLDLSNI